MKSNQSIGLSVVHVFVMVVIPSRWTTTL